MAAKKEKIKKTGTKRETPVLNKRRLHDETVKEYLSEHDTAKSFFKEYLPAQVVKNLDFRTLKICKDSFVSKKLLKYFSDILYQVHLKGESIFIWPGMPGIYRKMNSVNRFPGYLKKEAITWLL